MYRCKCVGNDKLAFVCTSRYRSNTERALKACPSPASPDTELLASGELPDSKKAQLSLMTCVRQKNFMCVIFVRNLQKLKKITTPFPQIGLVVLILLVFGFLAARAIRLTP